MVLFAAAHAAAAALAAAADFNNDFSSQQSTVDLPLRSFAARSEPEPPAARAARLGAACRLTTRPVLRCSSGAVARIRGR